MTTRHEPNSSSSLASSWQVARRVIVTTAWPGLHHWPAAPLMSNHLCVPHRHLFKFRVEWTVAHGEREVEFHDALSRVQDILIELSSGPLNLIDFETMSCEQIACMLHAKLDAWDAPSAVEVWEDGEHGARVEFKRLG